MNRKIEKEIIRLVDDDEDQRRALRFLLEAAGYEVRDYPSGRDFLVNDEPSVPGCAILDLQMPEMDGLTLLTIMREREYRVPVVFLSAHGDIPSTVEAMKKGSLDSLEKPVDSQKLCQLLSDILKKDRVTRKAGMEPEEAKKLFLKLSPRRQEIAKLISKGLLKREVAERLNINLKTVEAHCQFIYSQLNVHSVVELSSIICGAELSQD